MSKATPRHSPAPFRLLSGQTSHIIRDAIGDSIGVLALWTGDHPPEEQLANAQLFAAAPAMLRLLQDAAKQFAFYAEQHRTKRTPDGDAKARTNEDFEARIRAVIAEAGGR